MKNILLINSFETQEHDQENKYVPLGLMYLKSFIEKDKRYKVILKDLCIEVHGKENDMKEKYLSNEFINFIRATKPDFIGIGCLFSIRFGPVLKIIEKIRQIYPNIPIAIGGAHPTMFAEKLIHRHKDINYIILGAGEKSFVDLLDYHFNGMPKLESIDGITFMKNGNCVINPKNKYPKNIDDLPFPSYEDFSITDYYFDTSKWHNPHNYKFNYNFPIITSRGCPKRCSYCALPSLTGFKYRTRSAENVVDEIQYLYDKYDCRYVSFVDDNFTADISRAEEIMDEICRRNLKIQFDTSNGIDLTCVTERLLDKMVKAGAIRLTIAIETGSEDFRYKYLNKKVKNKQIYQFFKWASKHKNLKIGSYFMIGFPEESDKSLNATYEMIENLPFDYVSFNNVVPFYGTELFDRSVKNGFLNSVNVDNVDIDMMEANYEDKHSYIKFANIDITKLNAFNQKLKKLVTSKSLRTNRIMSSPLL